MGQHAGLRALEVIQGIAPDRSDALTIDNAEVRDDLGIVAFSGDVEEALMDFAAFAWEKCLEGMSANGI